MKRNTLIGLIIAGVCMIPVICVLLVGIIDGIWPWDKEVEYPLLSIILPKETEPEETTEPAQEGTEDETEGVEDTEPAGQGGQQSGGNQQSGSDETSESTETTGPETTTDPQNPTTPSQDGTTPPQTPTTGNNNGELPNEGDVTVEIQGGTSDGTTPGTQSPKDPTQATEPGGEVVQDITLDDLLNELFGNSSPTQGTNG